MPASRGVFATTIIHKVVMAVTGVVLFGFVLVHMTGNLLVYLGPEALNAYAEWLRAFLHGAGLWIARLVLLASAVLHIWAATVVTLRARAARPVGYRRWEPEESTYASRTMRWGGVIVLLFVIYHLLHFTFGTAHPDFRHGDVYRNFVVGFQQVPASLAYIVATLALGLHLRHGVWSMLRTLGLSHPRYTQRARAGAVLFALVVTLGNLSFPIAVLAGIVS
jgi:succinate dehydrogenase / fumarate reductase cytochrome b subunit